MSTATMPPRRKPQKGKPSEPPSVPLFLRLDAATAAALEEFLKSQEFTPEKGAVVRAALREWLAARGFPVK